MKTPIILQRLILDPKIFLTELDFRFNNKLNIIQGDSGSGKTFLLKIVKLLTDNKENLDSNLLKQISINKNENEKLFVFKYVLNPEFLHNDHSVDICICIKEEEVEIKSNPHLTPQEIDQIINGLNIQYINLDLIDSLIYSTAREDFINLSYGVRTWELFLEMTKDKVNSIILIDDIHSNFDMVYMSKFFQSLFELAKHNQILIASSNSLTSNLPYEGFTEKRFSEFYLKNPWQKNIYDYFKEDTKSDYYREFQLSIKNIKQILELKLNIDEKRLRDFLIRILYANIITTMETYLSDCFIEKIIRNKKLIPKLLELIPEYKNKKFKNLKKAYDWFENIHDNIIDDLLGISFHNLAKVKSMYEDILNIEFPKDLGDIFRAVLKRHDIVHRNGKTKDNKELGLTKLDLDNLIESVNEFIKNIELKAKEI